MGKETLKIVIVGHVDHGKSTVIGRLLLDTNSLPKTTIADLRRISKELGKDMELAYLTDQLKEERERNITIDTTQIFFGTGHRNFVIIDAPGHVEFLKNMISGATLAEVAVLVIDTKEGIMEQTRRHAYILSFLGIEEIIVLFNKMDLVNYEEKIFEEVKNGILGFFSSLNRSPAFMIPISAWEGENISRKSAKISWSSAPPFLDALESIRPARRNEPRPLRFPIQDIYEVNSKEVIVGRVASGEIRQDQEVIMFPGGESFVIKKVLSYGDDRKKEASRGESIGVTLDRSGFAKRGEVIMEKNNPSPPISQFKGNLFWMSGEPLKPHKSFTLQLSTQEVRCCALKISHRINSSTLEVIEEEAGELQINEAAEISFETESPIVAEKFSFIEELGRFVIEDHHCLQGAGIITG